MALDSVCNAGCISENITKGDHNGDRSNLKCSRDRSLWTVLSGNWLFILPDNHGGVRMNS